MEEEKEENKIRFQTELEFVELLANPAYLNYLAQNQFLEDEGMINYLQYLQYWKQPEYAKFILYPHCIFFLDMLQHKSFREECKNTEFCNFLTKQQGLHWNFYKQNRENTSSSTEPTNDAEQIPENDEKQ